MAICSCTRRIRASDPTAGPDRGPLRGRPSVPRMKNRSPGIWSRPVGRADLPGAPGHHDVLVADACVGCHVVGRACLSAISGGATAQVLRGRNGADLAASVPVGKTRVDFAVLDGDRVTCVVEVKLAMLGPAHGTWEDSKDFVQMRGYWQGLGAAPGDPDGRQPDLPVLPPNGATPSRIVDRAHATDEDLDCIRRHLTGVA